MKENIYDNSNIAESYAGATTPLTFSFVRYVYQEVYQHFSKMMGASDYLIRENKGTFEHMVEFIGQRIYYNLNSWYKMLSFFPGYRLSSEFMEKMMGVEKHASLIKKEYNFYEKYLLYFPITIFQFIKISLTFIFLGLRIKKFNRYFDKIFLDLNSIELNNLALAELKNSYEELDNKLLSQWRVPIANDFAVMVSAGLADRIFKKWLNSDNAYSYMQPAANKPLTSLDPGNKLIQIAYLVKEDEIIHRLFLEHKEEEIIKSLYNKYTSHKVTQEIKLYIKKFGSRMPNELKLESETLAENPKNFISLIKTLVHGELIQNNAIKAEYLENNYKNLNFFKKAFLGWLLHWAGNSIYRREDSRFRRTLVFGHVRKIFIEIGKQMEKSRFIDNTRDIFYLSIEEIFSIIDGKKLNFDTLNIIEQRKLELEKWKNIEMSRRFETTKSISEIENNLLNKSSFSQKEDSYQLKGIVASQPNNIHIFSGTTLTLKDFDPLANFEGKILVTCQTDPGWTVIFPLLKGIVVERGGMLSHAAIVARELNIPCIVGVQQATDFFPTNIRIELNLQNGLIQRL
jgi:pyruvate,water dikinase